MGRPSKGERVAIALRLPLALADKIKEIAPTDRHGFIVDAVEAKLKEQANG